VAAIVPLMALAVCGVVRLGSVTPSPVLVGYLRNLVSANYAAAYAETTLPLSMTEGSSTNPSTAALSGAHFAAFEARDPIQSFRVVRSYGRQIEAEIIHRNSGEAIEDLWLNGDRVQSGVQIATLDVSGGPLPSLFVDGVLTKVASNPQPVVTFLGDTGRFDNQYVFAVIDGAHQISAPEGSSTAAFTMKIGPSNFELPITLRPSERAIRSAMSILAGWRDSCGSACSLKTCNTWSLLPVAWLVNGASFHPTNFQVINRGRTNRSIVVYGVARSGRKAVTGGLVIYVSQSGVFRLAAACLDP